MDQEIILSVGAHGILKEVTNPDLDHSLPMIEHQKEGIEITVIVMKIETQIMVINVIRKTDEP